MTLGSASIATTGFVSALNSFIGPTANGGLADVVFNTAANGMDMPFKTATNGSGGSGRVFFRLVSVQPIPTPAAAAVHIPTRGLADFRLALSETFQFWGPYLFGGVLNEDAFAPYLTYKKVEEKEIPSLIKKPKTVEEEIRVRAKRKKSPSPSKKSKELQKRINP